MRGLLYFLISCQLKLLGMKKEMLRRFIQKIVAFAGTLFRKRKRNNDDDFFGHPYAIL
jgi:hypothetical protein